MAEAPRDDSTSLSREVLGPALLTISETSVRLITSGGFLQSSSDDDFPARLKAAFAAYEAFSESSEWRGIGFEPYLKGLEAKEAALGEALGACLFGGGAGERLRRTLVAWMRVARDEAYFLRVLIIADGADSEAAVGEGVASLPWEAAHLPVPDAEDLATRQVKEGPVVVLGDSLDLAVSRLGPQHTLRPSFEPAPLREVATLSQVFVGAQTRWEGSSMARAFESTSGLLNVLNGVFSESLYAESTRATQMAVPPQMPDILQVVGHASSSESSLRISHVAPRSPLEVTRLDEFELFQHVGRPRGLLTLMSCGHGQKFDFGEAAARLAPSTLHYNSPLPTDSVGLLSALYLSYLFDSGYIDFAVQRTRVTLANLRARIPKKKLEYFHRFHLRLDTQVAHNLDYFLWHRRPVRQGVLNALVSAFVAGDSSASITTIQALQKDLGTEREGGRTKVRGPKRSNWVLPDFTGSVLPEAYTQFEGSGGEDTKFNVDLPVLGESDGCPNQLFAPVEVIEVVKAGGTATVRVTKDGKKTDLEVDTKDECLVHRGSWKDINPGSRLKGTKKVLYYPKDEAQGMKLYPDLSDKFPKDDDDILGTFERFTGPYCDLLEASLKAIAGAEAFRGALEHYADLDLEGGLDALEKVFERANDGVRGILLGINGRVRLDAPKSVSWSRRYVDFAPNLATSEDSPLATPEARSALLGFVHGLCIALGVARHGAQSDDVRAALVDYYGEGWIETLINRFAKL